MAKTIQIRRNEGPSAKVPANGLLDKGELAVDLISGHLYVGTGTETSDAPIVLNPSTAPATTTTAGVVIIGDGLLVDSTGLIQTDIQTVAGKTADDTHNVVLTPSDIGALDATATAVAATKLATSRQISISQGATATAVNFDGTANANLVVSNVDHSYIDRASWSAPDNQILTSNGWVAEADFTLNGGTF